MSSVNDLGSGYCIDCDGSQRTAGRCLQKWRRKCGDWIEIFGTMRYRDSGNTSCDVNGLPSFYKTECSLLRSEKECSPITRLFITSFELSNSLIQ